MNTIKNQGVWRLYDRHATLILTDERQLSRIIEAPTAPLFSDEERGFSGEKRGIYPVDTTLDSFMKDAAARGCTRVEVSYDFFFGGTTRENYPDSPLTIKAFKVIHDYAFKHGMAFGASLISPLDLGGGYAQQHDNTGFTWQFQKGEIDNGAYVIRMRRQLQWYNNKGPISLVLTRVMAVAFDAQETENPHMRAVDERNIVDISDTAGYRIIDGTYKLTGAGYAYDEMEVYGKTDLARCNVLVVAEYRTPEIDYFDAGAQAYIHGVIDQHHAAGIRYQGYYSDEMHIQFDWDLSEHFGPTEITTRYITPKLIEVFADKYGEQYRDFLRYMVYFVHFPLGDGSWGQYAMAPGEDGAYGTWLFRKRYFELLSQRVVELSLDAKSYSETLFGGPIMTRAHATWQESPTCDHFAPGHGFQVEPDAPVTRYDYDTPYVWSSTIRENVSACGDYFRWNDFLTGSGTDHPEGGFLDRNYYAQAFACSLGNLNAFQRAYCAAWGSPAAVIRRLKAVGATYGTDSIEHGIAQGMEHRISDVLMLYPTELNYVEERFGSWMVQYGYCDYITEEMLIRYASVNRDGTLAVRGRSYRALVALFEAFVSKKTLALLERFVSAGGTLLWTGVPCVRSDEGENLQQMFLHGFGLQSVQDAGVPECVAGKSVRFEGILADVKPMDIRTDLLPDRVYPIQTAGAQVVARLDDVPVGAVMSHGAGRAVYLGFRPRDDQSQSMGKDVQTLFDILQALSAYGPDSLEARSRPEGARYVMNRFPNGSISIANHYRTFAEHWYGSFFRDEKRDQELLQGRQLPPLEIMLEDEEILGHCVSYAGTDAVTFRMDAESGVLSAFVGEDTDGIEIDGIHHRLFDRKASIAFAQVPDKFLADGIKRLFLLKADRPGTFAFALPSGFRDIRCEACEMDYLHTSFTVAYTLANNRITVQLGEREKNLWIAVYELE